MFPIKFNRACDIIGRDSSGCGRGLQVAVQNETELYEPIKRMLEEQGYSVKGEVNHCDIVAYRDGDSAPMIIELKKTFNLALLFQVMDRLKLSDEVYAAVEYHPKKRVSTGASWNDAVRLCRKLGIGLIGVQFYKRKAPAVDILCRPGDAAAQRRSVAKAKRLKQEFDRRSGDYNIGGSTRTKVITVYRERALRLAQLLADEGPQSPKALRERLHDGGVYAMLRRNVYGWFEKVEHGVYGITEAGRKALHEFEHVLSKT